ncbi:unnamed protein product [Lota lota]
MLASFDKWEVVLAALRQTLPTPTAPPPTIIQTPSHTQKLLEGRPPPYAPPLHPSLEEQKSPISEKKQTDKNRNPVGKLKLGPDYCDVYDCGPRAIQAPVLFITQAKVAGGFPFEWTDNYPTPDGYPNPDDDPNAHRGGRPDDDQMDLDDNDEDEESVTSERGTAVRHETRDGGPTKQDPVILRTNVIEGRAGAGACLPRPSYDTRSKTRAAQESLRGGRCDTPPFTPIPQLDEDDLILWKSQGDHRK